MKVPKSLLFSFLAAIALCIGGHASTLKQLNPSVWTNYTRMDFENLTQEQKTNKLQKLFEDKLEFCKKYNTRRALIRVLDPGAFAFFLPENFSHERDDNFLYWALKLGNYSEVEVIFDAESFKLTPSAYTDRLVDLTKAFFRVESHLPFFKNFTEKLLWVSYLNDYSEGLNINGPIIKGITINPQGLEDGQVQLVINALDQYKHDVSENFPRNQFPSIRLGAVLSLDQRNLAFTNLGRFPLNTDIRALNSNSIGLSLPENFPSEDEDLNAPSWRKNDNSPLLDTIYLNLGDPRLIVPIYQNLDVLNDPSKPNPKAVALLSNYLSHCMRGIPFIKGPGKISIDKGTNTIKGTYTFFRTGTQKNAIGKFSSENQIEIRPPYFPEVMSKYICENPESNKAMDVCSSFSTTTDINDAEYYMSPIPVRWNSTRISNHLAAKIYYVLSTEFSPPEKTYFGNWDIVNFLDFIYRKENVRKGNSVLSGFLAGDFYWGFRKGVSPTNNIVIYDFTTIPNGFPYPECDWGTGNKTHL